MNAGDTQAQDPENIRNTDGGKMHRQWRRSGVFSLLTLNRFHTFF